MSLADRPATFPVLIDEVMRYLAPGAGGIFIDGTFGAGGYTRAHPRQPAPRSSPSTATRTRSPPARELDAAAGGRLTLVEGRFSELDRIAARARPRRVDGVVLDIGVSSMQLDEAGARLLLPP